MAGFHTILSLFTLGYLLNLPLRRGCLPVLCGFAGGGISTTCQATNGLASESGDGKKAAKADDSTTLPGSWISALREKQPGLGRKVCGFGGEQGLESGQRRLNRRRCPGY